MQHARIELIGADLDGTLLNDDKQLCEGAAETIKEAVHRGIPFVPITGRPLSGIPTCIREFREIRYLICSNGAQIIDNRSGESLYSFTIPNARCRELIALLRRLDCMFEAFTDGVGCCEADVYAYYRNAFRDTVLADYIFSSRKVVERLEPLFEDGSREADEFFVNCAEPAVRDALFRELRKMPDLQVCLLGDRFAEITQKGTDKGEALAVICRHLGIATENTLAFGDGENDLLFLKKAGVAVAMANACPAVKENADILAASNNDNGVCRIIQQVLDGITDSGRR